MSLRYFIIVVCTIVVVAATAYFLFRPAPAAEVQQSLTTNSKDMVAIQMPSIEGSAIKGQQIFERTCATCHGVNAVGKLGSGPPLIHLIYEPRHHSDEAFQRAVAIGVRSHHWQFGDMPPIQGLTRGDVALIIEYIRTIQRANGI